MLQASKVFEQNKTRAVLNWVTSYYWYNKDISEMIQNSLRHYRDYVLSDNGIEKDMTLEQVKTGYKNYVSNCVTDIDYLQRELTKERKTYIKPSAKNLTEFFKLEELPFTKVSEYQKFLADHVLHEF